MSQFKWDAKKSDQIYIDVICDRYMHLCPTRDRQNAEMDLICTHHHLFKLDFKKLASFPDNELLHDVEGIANNIWRAFPPAMLNHFVPRCAA